MVICKILQVLKQSKKIPIDEIIAMHIDYANRPESGREAAYVKEWSESLSCRCNIRVINEVTRGITDRDAYEKISRTIRYGFYQESIASALQGKFNFDSPSIAIVGEEKKEKEGEEQDIVYHVSGILFGHHLGDVQENVISNVMRYVEHQFNFLSLFVFEQLFIFSLRGSGPLDLSGMTETSLVNNVFVWRPLLQHVKEDIYHFAHKYGVPYFKDSTPSWSTRGKLRNQLIPLLTEIYGEGCLRNLSNLAYESDQTQHLVYSNLYQPFFE
jgi:tRNA(Ile)-lysidine synthase TilS/MesJ